jgi:hypothetical protein
MLTRSTTVTLRNVVECLFTTESIFFSMAAAITDFNTVSTELGTGEEAQHRKAS